MKIKTSELADEALNWAVAKCKGIDLRGDALIHGPHVGHLVYRSRPDFHPYHWERWKPSTDWSQAGPIIERERIQVFPHNGATEWCGVAHVQRDGYIAILTQDGPTPLIAAMRCFVASKLGDEVDVPDELLGD